MLPFGRALVCAIVLCTAQTPTVAVEASKPPPLGEDGPAAGTLPGVLPPLPLPPPPSARPPSPDSGAAASGSGFAVADGALLTNAHVVAGCRRVVARNAGGEREVARVDAMDAASDLALLAVRRDFAPPLTFRDAPPVSLGERVITMGFPLSGVLSSGPSLTAGEVSALAGLRDNPLHFQISAPVQPGNSGGPLLDSQGHVAGVVVAKLNAARIAEMTGGDIPQNVNFAIKGTRALDFLRLRGVPVRTAASTGPDEKPSDLGAIARPSTVFLQCYR